MWSPAVPITFGALIGDLQRDWARLETVAGLAEVRGHPATEPQSLHAGA